MATASSCVWVNTASAVAWSPSIRWLKPTNSASPGRSALSPREQPDRHLGVGTHLGRPVPAAQHAQVGEPGGDRGAVRELAVGRTGLGEGGPPLGGGGVAPQRLEPGPEDRHLRVLVEQALGAEPVEPPAGGGGPTGCERRLHVRGDQPGDAAGIHRLLGVGDGGLREPVRLEPHRRPPVQERHQLRLVPAQVGEEQFPEQAVVAVPAPVPVERDDEVVGALELVEQLPEILGCRARRRTAARSVARGSRCG